MAPGEVSGQRRRNRGKKTGGGKPGQASGNNNKGKQADKQVIKKGKGSTRNVAKNPPPGKGKYQKGKQTQQQQQQQQQKGGKKQQQQQQPKGGGKKGGKAKPVREQKKALTAEELEAQMDDYWMKSKDTTVAAKKLDEDMDSYWSKKGEGEAETKEGEDAVVAPVEEVKEDDKKEEEGATS